MTVVALLNDMLQWFNYLCKYTSDFWGMDFLQLRRNFVVSLRYNIVACFREEVWSVPNMYEGQCKYRPAYIIMSFAVPGKNIQSLSHVGRGFAAISYMPY
jgi:hypothetical protein